MLAPPTQTHKDPWWLSDSDLDGLIDLLCFILAPALLPLTFSSHAVVIKSSQSRAPFRDERMIHRRSAKLSTSLQAESYFQTLVSREPNACCFWFFSASELAAVRTTLPPSLCFFLLFCPRDADKQLLFMQLFIETHRDCLLVLLYCSVSVHVLGGVLLIVGAVMRFCIKKNSSCRVFKSQQTHIDKQYHVKSDDLHL